MPYRIISNRHYRFISCDMTVDTKVDGALPLEVILSENIPLREMILSMDVGKKWLFTNAGKTVDAVTCRPNENMTLILRPLV